MTDGPWEIPDGWCWTEMSEISTIVGGGTPSTTDQTNFSKPGEGIGWVTPADLSGYTDKFIARGSRDITPKGLKTSGARVMPPGSVLFSSRAPIGYVVISSGPVSTNQGFKSFVPENGIESSFLYYYLQRARTLVVDRASGTTFKEISGAKIAAVPFPLTSAQEQSRIVEGIESYVSRLDAAVASLERTQARLKAYRASVLKAAVEGRLVPTEAELARAEKRDYEPAGVLLKRILAERRRRWEEAELAKLKTAGKTPRGDTWKAKYQEPAAPNPDGLPELPDGWCWANIDSLASRIQYGTSAKTSGDDPTGVPVVRMGNIIDGALDFRALKYLPQDHEEFPDLFLRPGDLLFNRTNSAELVGKSAVYAGYPERCSFASYLIKVEIIQGCDPRWASFVLNSSFGRHWIASVVSQQVGQANVNGTKLKACPIPLPPATEQQRVVSTIEQVFSNEESILESVRFNLVRCARLRQAILKWAFEGILVDQNPNDEPAEQLLERIRADGVSSFSSKGSRRRRVRAAS